MLLIRWQNDKTTSKPLFGLVVPSRRRKTFDPFTTAKVVVVGSGCGSFGKVVASNTSGPRFESSHRRNFVHLFHINCIEKTKIKKKGRKWSIKKALVATTSTEAARVIKRLGSEALYKASSTASSVLPTWGQPWPFYLSSLFLNDWWMEFKRRTTSANLRLTLLS